MNTCTWRTVVVILLAAVALPPLPAPAQSEPPAKAAAAPPNPLEPLGHLVGGEWHGKLELVDGAVIRARHVFEWGLGRRILKSKTYGAVGDGPEQLVYEGVYGWHPEKKAIVFREFSAFNSVNEGTVTPEGNALHYAWAEHSSKGVTEYRETLRFPDTDHYVSEGDRKTGDGWEKCVESAFRREAATKTDPTAKEMR